MNWQKEALRQQSRKNVYKRRYYVSLTVAAFLGGLCSVLGGLLVHSLREAAPPPPVPFVAPAQHVEGETPDHVLASILIANGGVRCSATVVSLGDEYAGAVSAAHCFTGRIGGKFWAYNPDGSTMQAELLAFDRAKDLALFKLPADKVLAHVQIPQSVPEGNDLDACGYTAGQGPKYKQIRYASQSHWRSGGDDRWVWELNTVSGPAWGGDSGGGVFKNRLLVGVITNADYQNVGRGETRSKKLFATAHAELVAFMDKHAGPANGDGWNCGPWGCAPDGAPPPPAPPEHDRGIGPPPPFQPSPNVPIRPKRQRPPRPPEDLDTCREMQAEIDRLRKLVDELQKRIGEGSEAGPPGPPGPPGPQGPKGDPGPLGPELDKLGLDLQRTQGDVEAVKREIELHKGRIAELEKGLRESEIKDQHQDVEILRITERVEGVERKISGSLKVTVRRDPTGSYSVEERK